MENKQKWAIILGASGGMGWAVAEKMALSGWNIFGIIRERKAQESFWQEQAVQLEEKSRNRVWFINADGIREESVSALLDQFLAEAGKKSVHLFLHALAKGNLKSLSEKGTLGMSVTDLLLTYEAMAASWWTWVSEMRKRELPAKGMSNISLSSVGSFRVWPYYAAVGMSKAALENLGASMAVELGAEGIRTNVLRPGVTPTQALHKIPGSARLLEAAEQNNPLGRTTLPQDVANVVYLLTTPEASFINGAVIPVDGGESLL